MNIEQLAQDAFHELIFRQEIIDTPIRQATLKLVAIALIIASILYLFVLGYNYIKESIKSLGGMGTKFFDWDDFVRTLVLMGLIVLYLPLVTAVVDLGEYFNKLSAPTSAQSKRLEEYSAKFLSDGETYVASDGEEASLKAILKSENAPDGMKQWAQTNINNISDKAKYPYEGLKEGDDKTVQEAKGGVADVFSTIWKYSPMGMAYNAVKAGVGGLLFIVAKMIKAIIIMITTVVLKVLIVLGPLAIAFSIIPAFQKQIEIWASTLLGTLFVYTTLNVLDHIFYSHMVYVYKHGGFLETTGSTIYYTVYTVMYLMAFWLTSKVIGKGDAGRVLTKMVGIATAAVGAGMLAGGAAAGGAGGSNLGNIASSAGNAISPEE